MKNKLKMIFGLVIIAGLFSCGSPKKTLMKVEQKALAEGIHTYYEAMRNAGLIDFADNGSIEMNLAFDDFAELMQDKNGDLSALEGVGIGLYENISYKNKTFQLELSITKADKALPLLNIDFNEDKITASIPFTEGNKTFFIKIADLNNGEVSAEEFDKFLVGYKQMINSFNARMTEKEIVYALNHLIKEYYANIDIKEEDGFYTYSVSKEQSKEILLNLYGTIYSGFKYKFPAYASEEYEQMWGEITRAIQDSEGIAYSVRKKVEGGKIVKNIVTFETEAAEPIKIVSDASATEQTTTGKVESEDVSFEINSKKTIDGDTSKTIFDMFVSEKNKAQALGVTFNSEMTPKKHFIHSAYVMKFDEKPSFFTFTYNGEKKDDRTDYGVIFDLNGTESDPEKFKFTVFSDGYCKKTDESIILDGDLNFVKSDANSTEQKLIMTFLYKINKDQVRQLEFAADDQQINLLEADKNEVAMTLQNSFMELVPELERLGIDRSVLSNLK